MVGHGVEADFERDLRRGGLTVRAFRRVFLGRAITRAAVVD